MISLLVIVLIIFLASSPDPIPGPTFLFRRGFKKDEKKRDAFSEFQQYCFNIYVRMGGRIKPSS